MSQADKTLPVRLSGTTLYESAWVNLYGDKVATPNGRLSERYHFLNFSHGRGYVGFSLKKLNHALRRKETTDGLALTGLLLHLNRF